MIRVKGQVQGVNFRSSTVTEAAALGLTGRVRNLPDGSVEVITEGARSAVEELIAWCHHGPIRAQVDNLRVEWLTANGEFCDFKIEH